MAKIIDFYKIHDTSNGNGGGGSTIIKQLEPLEEPGVQYIDYDGTVLYQYTHEEFQKLSAHPEQPAHEGLFNDGWNTPDFGDALSFSKNHPKSIITIGALYATTRDSVSVTKIHFHVGQVSNTTIPTVTLQFRANGPITVDWGDGSAVQSTSGTNYSDVSVTHSYNVEGDYVISISGEIRFYRGPNIGYNARSGVFKKYFHVAAITEINFGDTVTFDTYAFAHCINLEKVSVPASLLIEDNTEGCFAGCLNLKSFTFNKQMSTRHHGTFMSCYKLETVSVPIVSTEFLAESLFEECSNLKSFTAKNVVSRVGLNDCYSLTACCIESFTDRDEAFFLSNNYELKYLDVPPVSNVITSMFGANYKQETYDFSGVYWISEMAFFSNFTLKEIYLPASVQVMGAQAFMACASLQRIVMESNTPPYIGAMCFDSIDPECRIIVPDGSGDTYKNATNWTDYASNIHEASEEE